MTVTPPIFTPSPDERATAHLLCSGSNDSGMRAKRQTKPVHAIGRIHYPADKFILRVGWLFCGPKGPLGKQQMKMIPRAIQLRLDPTTRAVLQNAADALFSPDTQVDDAVHFVIDLALVNIHLLRRHINGAIDYAERTGVSLREVLADQLLLQLLTNKKGTK